MPATSGGFELSGLSQNRLALSLLIFIAWASIGWVGGPVLAMFGEPSIEFFGLSIPKQLLAAVIFAIAVSAFFERDELGLVPPGSTKSLLLMWPPVIYGLAFCAAAVVLGPPSSDIALPLLLTATLGAISQEMIFRGMLFAGFRSRYSIRTTVAATSVLSGFAWLPLWIWYGMWEQGVWDVLNGIFLGILFAAIRVRTGSLYACIALHAFWSYSLILLRMTTNEQLAGAIQFAAVVLPLAAYGAFLLRRKVVVSMEHTAG